jgi:hypothetical protein
VRQGRQGGKVDKEEESSTIQTYEDLIIFSRWKSFCPIAIAK